MIRLAVAQNYARALYQLSQEKGISHQVLSGLEFLESYLQTESSLEGILCHPLIGKKAKKELLQEILNLKEDEPPEELYSYLFLMVDKGRSGLLPQTIEQYRRCYQEERDIQVVEVISPGKLKEKQKEIIVDNMQRYTGRQVVLEEKTDPSLKGGVVLKIGSHMLDGSLDTRLKRLEKQLVQSGSK